MAWLKQYLLSVTAAAIVCAIVKSIIDKKSPQSQIIQLLAGIFLTIAVVAPWLKLDLSAMTGYVTQFTAESDAAVATGTAYARNETAAIIKSQTEAYILDKAQTLGLEIQVNVSLSEDPLPVPTAVVLTGTASPYAKQRLTQYISENLGIGEEHQQWI